MRDEMDTLVDKLNIANIPYEVELEADFGAINLHLFYPKKTDNFNSMCSIICNKYSYGGKDGLLEMYGRFAEDPIGYLTANEAFAYIYTDYMNSAD